VHAFLPSVKCAIGQAIHNLKDLLAKLGVADAVPKPDLSDVRERIQDVQFSLTRISRPTVFAAQLQKSFADEMSVPCDEELKQIWREAKKDTKLQRSLESMRSDLKAKAVGCTECCPYCHRKCRELVTEVSHTHSCHHRVAGFGLSLLSTGREFVFDICTSSSNFDSFWIRGKPAASEEEHFRRALDPEVKRRLDDAGASSEGIMRFTLSWNTSDDLDLRVYTPRSVCISDGNREHDAGGFLDVDRNDRTTVADPVENIRYNTDTTPHPGRYRVVVVNYNYRTSPSPVSLKMSMLIHGHERKREFVDAFTAEREVEVASFTYDSFCPEWPSSELPEGSDMWSRELPEGSDARQEDLISFEQHVREYAAPRGWRIIENFDPIEERILHEKQKMAWVALSEAGHFMANYARDTIRGCDPRISDTHPYPWKVQYRKWWHGDSMCKCCMADLSSLTTKTCRNCNTRVCTTCFEERLERKWCVRCSASNRGRSKTLGAWEHPAEAGSSGGGGCTDLQ
jgi:hypothetical protein